MKKFLVTSLIAVLALGNFALAKPGGGGFRSSSGRSYSRPSSSRPSSSRPSSSRPSSSRPKYSSPNTSSKPSASSSSSSSKPSGGTFDSSAARAQKQQQSRAQYIKTQPKNNYTAPNGKSVKIDAQSPSAQRIQKLDETKFADRQNRVEHHYHNHYGNRYDYYRSQPPIYIGGGYSPIFWYAMLEWDAHRRAQWAYHNWAAIDAARQADLMRDAAFQAEIAKLRAQNVQVNANYVDKQFQGNEDLMYDDEYVNAVYNPKVVHSPTSIFKVLMIMGLIIIVGGLVVWLLFIKEW